MNRASLEERGSFTANLHKTESYDYELPDAQIAQVPAEPRDSSRLLVLERNGFRIEHRLFREIPAFFRAGDLLVLNDAKVIPARLIGKKAEGTAVVEVFLLRPLDPGWERWEALVRPGRRLQPGSRVQFERGEIAVVGERKPDGLREVTFSGIPDVHGFIEREGKVPFPPYISNDRIEPARYQTVYARSEGAVAAPTAGLHFTEGLLAQIASSGVELARLTLHVGIGTFRPVKEADIRKHPMHEEFFEIPEETADRVNSAKKEGRRVVAVGTTVVRALEAASRGGYCRAGVDSTGLFIYPGYGFKMVDALVTNFHLPKSSLMMLVSAFAGYEAVMAAYRLAVRENYRFFSFGDAMLII